MDYASYLNNFIWLVGEMLFYVIVLIIFAGVVCVMAIIPEELREKQEQWKRNTKHMNPNPIENEKENQDVNSMD